MRTIPVESSKGKADVVEITRLKQIKVQMLTESKEAKGLKGKRKLRDQLVERYIKNIFIHGSEDDIALVESVEKIIEDAMSIIDVPRTMQESEANLLYAETILEDVSDIEDDVFVQRYLLGKAKVLNENVDSFLREDISVGMEEEVQISESLVLTRFFDLKSQTLLEGDYDFGDNGEIMNEILVERSLKQVKTLLLVENSGLRIKKNVRAKELEEKLIAPLLDLVK